MRVARLLGAAVAAVALLPAAAAAAPPPNDAYLGSTRIVAPGGELPREYADQVNTAEATTQPDLFDPDSRGRPFGGGDPEPTACEDGTAYGRTAWWDFEPPFPGRVEIDVTGTFDVVVAVHEWSEQTTRITNTVRCEAAGGSTETVRLPEVQAGGDYTVQVGGAGDSGGPLRLELRYLPDRDGDGLLDTRDRCDRLAGLTRAGGCPPRVRAVPRLRVSPAPGGGVMLRGLRLTGLPRGARAEVRCRRCGPRVVRRARRAGSLALPGFAGRVVRAEDRIELRVTLRATSTGRYRFGAFGRLYRWPVTASGLGERVARCLSPRTQRARRCP